MNRPLVIGLGEILWDLLPGGKQLGGAPANFAYHAHALGAESLTVSRVGDDPLGREILARLNELGLATEGISVDPAAPTGTVTVALDSQGHPSYTIHESVAWDFLEASPAVLQAAAQAQAVCFGSLAQRHPVARTAVRAVVDATPPEALRIFDINLRQRFYSRELIEESLGLANVLKINDGELSVVAELLGLAGDPPSLLRQLASRYALRAVALTLGGQGSSLLVCDEVVSRPAAPVAIADTVGAGDSYTAALALGLLAGHPAERILAKCHALAEYVCTQPGATPPVPASIRSM